MDENKRRISYLKGLVALIATSSSFSISILQALVKERAGSLPFWIEFCLFFWCVGITVYLVGEYKASNMDRDN